MARDFFKYSYSELEELFQKSKNNPDLLRRIDDELKHRKTPKALKLKSNIENLLGSKPEELKNFNLFDNIDKANTYNRQNISREQAANNFTKENLHPKHRVKPTKASSSKMPEKSAGIRIRPSGNIKGLPQKYSPELKKDVKISLQKDAPKVQLFEKALKLLIEEMQKKGDGIYQFTLENGKRVKIGGNDTGYQFIFEGSAELFEGASVAMGFEGKTIVGTVAAVMPKQIIIALKTDLGEEIQRCILRIDNTAMLEALRARMQNIINKEVEGINVQLAESVLSNSGAEMPPLIIDKEISKGLNDKQIEAIEKIFSNDYFFLWGPPGTGKTKTLCASTDLFFGQNKRILICSNTNQAVDQVLLKLCERLGRSNEALQNGEILRIGKIAHTDLNNNWSELILLEEIVASKSKELLERKNELENMLQKLNDESDSLYEILNYFTLEMEGKNKLDQIKFKLKNISGEIASVKSQQLNYKSKIDSLINDKNKVNAGGIMNIFRKSIVEIDKDLEKSKNELIYLQDKEVKLNNSVSSIHQEHEAINKELAFLAGKTNQYNKHSLENRIKEYEKKKQPITDELAVINGQLDNVSKTVVQNARIVGATITKIYLSPQLFTSFEIVIIDEASMVMLPALYNAVSLAKERVVISGDFRQLAPIVQTQEEEIQKIIGNDIFHVAGIAAAFNGNRKLNRTVMLEEQYRMNEDICNIISRKIYKGRLKTSAAINIDNKEMPASFSKALTIVDTSSIVPFVNKDNYKSKYNIMNSLAIKNLSIFFEANGIIKENTFGICTPYAAQAKILKSTLEGSGLSGFDVGTVHRFQGDEKDIIVVDIPDSFGQKQVGYFLQADKPDEDGARLFNVAISRAKNHLIVIANLDYLDAKLPNHAILRDMLSMMERQGKVVDVKDVLALYPIAEELRCFDKEFDFTEETLRTGLFSEADFHKVCSLDLQNATRNIIIYSGFITEGRVATYESIFRRKVAEGVKIKCITRPPFRNGQIPYDNAKAALDGLESFGCIVDTRGDIHEKAVIIDQKINWFGSLNPLSHTENTSEVMARIEGENLAMQLLKFLSIKQLNKGYGDEIKFFEKDNPICPKCKARTAYMVGKYGPYWKCENCDWTISLKEYSRKESEQEIGLSDEGDMPRCPICNGETKLKRGKYGPFWGCSKYPHCKGIVKIKRISHSFLKGN